MTKIYKNKTELINNLIKKTDTVLDVGFWGQGVDFNNDNWVHNLLLNRSEKVYGIDIDFDEAKFPNTERYLKSSAEKFDFGVKFDVIFAGDVIEHLSNPGMFLESCSKNLKDGGRLIITTPNCFNLFNLAEKISKFEPTVNEDHTCYYNGKTIKQLLRKNNWSAEETAYLYSLEIGYKESIRKKFLNVIYNVLAKATPKFIETIVVIAKKNE